MAIEFDFAGVSWIRNLVTLFRKLIVLESEDTQGQITGPGHFCVLEPIAVVRSGIDLTDPGPGRCEGLAVRVVGENGKRLIPRPYLADAQFSALRIEHGGSAEVDDLVEPDFEDELRIEKRFVVARIEARLERARSNARRQLLVSIQPNLQRVEFCRGQAGEERLNASLEIVGRGRVVQEAAQEQQEDRNDRVLDGQLAAKVGALDFGRLLGLSNANITSAGHAPENLQNLLATVMIFAFGAWGFLARWRLARWRLMAIAGDVAGFRINLGQIPGPALVVGVVIGRVVWIAASTVFVSSHSSAPLVPRFS